MSKAATIAKKGAKAAVTNWKPILSVLGIGFAAFIAYKVATTITSGIDDWNPGNDPGSGGSGNQNPGGGSTTITTNQAQNIAAGLLAAMANGWGTDEDRIYNLLKGRSPQDFALISNAFGTPRYDGNGEAYFPFPETPLAHWLHSELNQEEMNHLKSIMPGVL